MKKIISSILIITLLFSILSSAIVIQAVDTMPLSLEIETETDNTVIVMVKADQEFQFATLEANVDYDDSVFTRSSNGTFNTNFDMGYLSSTDGFMMAANNVYTPPYMDTVESGTVLVTYTFTYADTAAPDDYTFTLNLTKMQDGDFADILPAETTAEATYTITGSSTPAEGYTVTIADEANGTAEVEIGDTVTMNVTVTGGSFNGIQGTVSFDKTLFTLTNAAGAAASDDEDTDAVELYSLSNTEYEDETVVATLTFEAIAAGTGDFDISATVGDYDDFKSDAVAANTVSDKVKVNEAAPEGYTVTVPTVDNADVTVSYSDNTYAEGDDFTAAAGTEITIAVEPAEGYEIESVSVEGVTVTDNGDGTYTFKMPEKAVEISVSVKESIVEPTFTVAVSEYATGVTLILVTGENANGYTYDGNAMYYVEQYQAYAWLVDGAVTEETAKALAAEAASGTPTTISAGYDVNNTGKVDFNDAGAAFGCYNKAYAVRDNMAMYLRADADNSKTVDASDVSVIMSNYTAE